MRRVVVGGITLQLESPESSRYLAPLLILPGMFQSAVCWRAVTSMLAHRGWDVYLLSRSPLEQGGVEQGWQRCLNDAVAAASGLGGKVILLGADLGAGLAMAMLDRVRPMALVLFAPCEPAHLATALQGTRGVLGRLRAQHRSGPVVAPAAVLRRATQGADASPESGSLLRDLAQGVAFARPATHPPAIVFAPEDDPLVETGHTLAFAATDYAKAAPTRLRGHWWPTSGWERVVDDVHRFLILTLSDRVVDFPEEILED